MTTQRVILKDGRLYRLAYGMRAKKNRPTGNVNLCDTVWLAAGWLAIYVCTGFVFIFCGCIVLAGLVAFCLIIWDILPPVIAWLTSPHLPPLSTRAISNLWGVAAAVSLCVVVFGIPTFFKTEMGRLLAAYLRAKKDRVCPIYEVV
jgi:hypothetical protein